MSRLGEDIFLRIIFVNKSIFTFHLPHPLILIPCLGLVVSCWVNFLPRETPGWELRYLYCSIRTNTQVSFQAALSALIKYISTFFINPGIATAGPVYPGPCQYSFIKHKYHFTRFIPLWLSNLSSYLWWDNST